MTDGNDTTNYGDMYTPPVTETEVEIELEAEHTFGKSAVVDGTPLIYDETVELWVYAENHDDLWEGETPVVAEPEVEPEVDQTAMDVVIGNTNDIVAEYVAVNVDEVARLRVRKETSLSGTPD